MSASDAIHDLPDKLRLALVVALGAGLFVIAVRVGALLDYIGGSSWMVVLLAAIGWWMTRVYPHAGWGGIRLHDLRTLAFWVTVALAVITSGATHSRDDLARQGREDRIISAVRHDPGALRRLDADALDGVRHRMPRQVDAELRRREEEQARLVVARAARERGNSASVREPMPPHGTSRITTRR